MAKKILYGFMVLAAVMSVSTISACRYYLTAGRMEAMMEKITVDLELSDAQKAQLESFRAEIKARSGELGSPYKSMMGEFLAQLESDTFDKTRLEEVYVKTADAREQLFATVITGISDFHASLTPKQKKLVTAKIEKMRAMGSRLRGEHKNY